MSSRVLLRKLFSQRFVNKRVLNSLPTAVRMSTTTRGLTQPKIINLSSLNTKKVCMRIRPFIWPYSNIQVDV